jgi:hypothetical protein
MAGGSPWRQRVSSFPTNAATLSANEVPTRNVLKERAILNPLPKPLEKQSSLTAHLAPLDEKAKAFNENAPRKAKKRDPAEQWKIDIWGVSRRSLSPND